jgi:tRNA/rRNA methyltransferase
MAKHAKPRLEDALFFPTLQEALAGFDRPLALASTARVGSVHRPHPLPVPVAVERALGKLEHGEVSDIVFVFGPEADGLSNEEVDLCDWVVTIPSSPEYRSLNLSQAVLIFSYEVNRRWSAALPSFQTEGRSQRERLISHFVGLAEEVGFVLPGDPYKMRPRLEEILSQLPPYLKDVNTLHGLLDQTLRSVRVGRPDFKGRYRHKAGVTDER